MKLSITVVAINFWVLLQLLNLETYAVVTIAIIGGGIGGTSCAEFLKNHLNHIGEIDIYEHNVLGGRLSAIKHNNYLYEMGGTIITVEDQYTHNFVKTNQLPTIPIIYPKYSIFKDGHLKELGMLGIIKHGLPILKAGLHHKSVDKYFQSIYKTQEERRSFKTVHDLIGSMGLSGVVRWSLLNYLNLQENERAAIQLESLPRIDYGKTIKLPFLAGYVSLTRVTGDKTRRFSLKFGNHRLAHTRLNNSGATRYRNKVIEVIKMPDNKIKIIYIKNEKTQEQESKLYDYVVVAHPLAENLPNIKFINFDDFLPVKGNFNKRVITILKGKLKKKFFRLTPIISSEPTDIIFYRHPIIDYIFKLEPYSSNIWKIQSPNKLVPDAESSSKLSSDKQSCNKLLPDKKNSSKLLPDKQKFSKLLPDKASSSKLLPDNPDYLDQIFENKEILSQTEWLAAYPDYTTYNPKDGGTFVLAQNLLYINCIEWAGSSIEMSTIGAFNVAHLIFNSVRNRIPIDPLPPY